MNDNIKLIVVRDYDQLSLESFKIIKNAIESGATNFGLATGSTPVGLYKLISEDAKENNIYKDLNYYNLDEYHNLPKSHSQSYYTFMREMLFDNIDASNCYIPNGEIDIEDSITAYQTILDDANIDMQLLGIGNNGHIGFNEPGTPFDIKTNFVKLKNSTREANKRFFNNNIDEVPEYAITMGIADIMKSKEILVIANGESKATAVYNMLYGEVNEQVPASILQKHNNVTVIIDESAASKLPLKTLAIDISSTRIKVATFDGYNERLSYEVVDHNKTDIYDTMISMAKSQMSSDIYHIGLSVSGYVYNGEVSNPAIDMDSFKIQELVEKDLNRRTSLINRANASAFGEFNTNFKGVDSLYYISLATGIGGGYVANGEIIKGKHGLVGEISNMIIDTHKFNDDFYADGSIEMHYKTFKYTGDEEIFVKQMGTVIANVINTIDPEIIILDRKNMDICDTLRVKIEDYVNSVVYSNKYKRIKLYKSELVDESLYGAAMYASIK